MTPGTRVAGAAADWTGLVERYRAARLSLAVRYERRMWGGLPADFAAWADDALWAVCAEAESIATCRASRDAIQVFDQALCEIVGGSADLTGFDSTKLTVARDVAKSKGGNHVDCGVREFGMAAIMDGMLRHGGHPAFVGTLLMFSEYARIALRMASLMTLNPISMFTHGSIALGQHGLTHQSIERLATLGRLPTWTSCAAVTLAARSENARVVSMSSTHGFSRQESGCGREVLSAGVPRVAVESGVTDCRRKYVSMEGGPVGIDTFGGSAPAGVLAALFGEAASKVVETAMALVRGAAAA